MLFYVWVKWPVHEGVIVGNIIVNVHFFCLKTLRMRVAPMEEVDMPTTGSLCNTFYCRNCTRAKNFIIKRASIKLFPWYFFIRRSVLGSFFLLPAPPFSSRLFTIIFLGNSSVDQFHQQAERVAQDKLLV